MKTIQRAFSEGELSPSYYARTDLARYHLALRTCRNFIIQQDGGLVNRPGTIYMMETKDSTAKSRLIRFVNDETRFLIEMGAHYMRFYKDHAQVLVTAPDAWADATDYVKGDLVENGGDNYYCILDHTSVAATDEPGVGTEWNGVWYLLSGDIFEIPTPWTTADLLDIQYSQSNDTIRLVAPGYPRMELTYTSDTGWILSEMVGGPITPTPASVVSTGGAVGVITYWAVTAVMDGTFEESLAGLFSGVDLVPSAGDPVSVTWDAVLNAVSYNIYRSEDGQTFGLIGSTGGTPNNEQSDNTWTSTSDTHTSSADNTTSEEASGAGNMANSLGAGNKAADGKYTFSFESEVTAPLGATGLFYGTARFEYSRDGEPYTDGGVGARVLNVQDGFGSSGVIAQQYVLDVPDNGYSSIEFRVRPGLMTGVIAAGSASFTVQAVNPPNDQITWQEALATFVDEGQEPDLAVAPPKTIIEFNSVAEYPAVIGHFQQRTLFANNPGGKNKVWASRIGSPGNFAYATPLQADDPVVFELDGRQTNPIRHLLDLGRLVVFTSTGELVAEGDQSGVMRPDAVNVRQHSYNGSNKLTPLVINNRALYVQARGSYVRSIHPDDVPGSISTNLSLQASHLFRGKSIVDWDAAIVPNSIVWCVRSDGILLGLTYLPEMETYGWHRHDTDGEFERVCVMPGVSNGVEEDIVYMIVKRTINAVTKRYIEYMPTRYFDASPAGIPFSDCAKVFGALGGSNVDVSHLKGKSVSVREGLTIGAVFASPNNPAYGAAKVVNVGTGLVDVGTVNSPIVGLPIIYDMQPLDVEKVEGTIKHDRVLVSRVVLHLDRTPSLWTGLPENPTTPAPLQGLQPLAAPLDAREKTDTGDGVRSVVPVSSWRSNGRFLARQVDPVPTSILMISAELAETDPEN